MPIRIDVLDATLTPERQAALADVLVRAGVEPEAAALAALMTPGPVVDVDSDAAYQAIGAELTAAGFTVEAAETAGTLGARPAAQPAPRKGVPASGWLAAGLGLVVVLLAGILIGTWTRPEAEPTPVVTTDTPPGANETRTADPEPLAEPEPAAAAPVGWTTGPTALPGPSNVTATLRTIRTGHHDGFDRVVFEFDGTVLPPVRIITGDMNMGTQLCQGDIPLEGDVSGTLLVSLGRTVDATGRRGEAPRLPALSEYWPACGGVGGDYPDALVYGVERTGPRPYRTQTLRNPLRLVVDVQA